MKQVIKLTAFILLSISLLNGCKKQPGLGGNAAITGSVRVRVYNENFSLMMEELDLSDEYVYLSAAGHPGYLDRVKTSFNGTYEFNYLNPGDYVVYAYSKDTTRVSINDIAVSVPVSITKQAQSVDAGTITVANTRAIGNSSISGRVMKQSQTNPNLQYAADDERVYIIFNDDLAYKTYTRTTFDGYYNFDRLPTGKYRIYAYSLDIDNISLSAYVPVMDSVMITQNGTDITLTDLVIY